MSGFAVFDTAIGPLGIAWRGDAITGLALPGRDREATAGRIAARSGALEAQPPPHVLRLIDELKRYSAGAHVSFDDVAIDLGAAGSLQRRIYDLTRSIPFGETRTYGDIAGALGEPGAARVVGRAMGDNPVPIIIPCHRVVAAGGRFGGFSAPGGVFTKERLLALEGAGAAGPLIPGLLA
jgi:methylated-DNA-[protein]-cysteine S-methyltransferase